MTLCALILAQALLAQEIRIVANKNINADFTRYSSFCWAAQLDRLSDESGFFFDDLVLKADVKQLLRDEMESLGYQFSRSNPDLLLNVRFFSRGGVVGSIEGIGRHYWASSEYSLWNDQEKYSVEAGTIILSVLDRRDRVILWQGVTSGIPERNEQDIKSAVTRLMEVFSTQAYIYSKR